MIPFNPFLLLYLLLFILTTAAGLALRVLNADYLRKHDKTVPEPFIGYIDEDRLHKIEEYTIDKTRLSLIESVFNKLVFLSIILSGLLPWLVDSLAGTHFIIAGLIFFAVPGVIGALVDLPFDYYHIFRIEERYGFNTRTMKTWILDLLKSLILSLVLGIPLLSMLLLMVMYGGNTWWIWAWLIFFSFQLLLMVLYPTVIAPLFNKFTPIEKEGLAQKISHLAEKEDIALKGIFQMDATKRSRHTNAYFSGLGKAKRIVLFDTLIEAHEDNEILAVLAHEAGHLKKKHIMKQLGIVGSASFGLLYVASEMIEWGTMYRSFGFNEMPLYAGLFLISILWEPVGFFLSPLGMSLSRKFEREADRHAYEALETGEPLMRALKKMARDNLSNLRPHPLFVRFNYSHPPLLERIESLKEMGERRS